MATALNPYCWVLEYITPPIGTPEAEVLALPKMIIASAPMDLAFMRI
jgi:hypothetical protein